MIFLILGTQKFQLNRLLLQIDELIEKGKLTEEVYAQIGHSDYIPQNYKYARFLDRTEFEKKITESDMIITHSGVGSIISAVQAHKPVVVFPRLERYNEHVDNHQLEIAQAFAKKNYVLCCEDANQLEIIINRARTHEFDIYHSSTEKIVELLDEFIEDVRMKEVVVLVGNAPSSLGGITTVINTINNSKVLKDFEILLIPTSYERKKIMHFVIGVMRFLYVCFKRKISLVHIHMSENGSCYRKMIIINICRVFRIPVVVHSHGSNFHTFYDGLKGWKKNMLKKSFAIVSKVIVLTESWKEYWSKIVEESKIVVLPNCVDVPNDLNKLESGSKLKLLFMGRLGERKGVYDIIYAAEILKKKGLNFEINLCGDGELDKCRKQIKDKQLQGMVNVLGWIDGEEKKRLLQISDVLLLPSYYESFGIVLLEAMAYRMPVICSDGGAMKEIVSDGEDGFVIHYGRPMEIAEKIEFLAQNPQKIVEMGEKGFKKVTGLYSEQIIMEQLKVIYEEIKR